MGEINEYAMASSERSSLREGLDEFSGALVSSSDLNSFSSTVLTFICPPFHL